MGAAPSMLRRRAGRAPAGPLLDGLAAALAGLAFAAAWLVGWRFVVPGFAYQILPLDALRERLAESIWNLHAQPPLLNLGLGLALKLEGLTGLDAAASLAAVQLAVGAGALVAARRLAAGLGLGPAATLAVLAVLAANPAFAYYLTTWFYPLQEMLLVLLTVLAGRRYLAGPTPARLAACALPAVGLVWLRSLFHPLWAVATLGFVVAAAPRAGEGDRGRPRRGTVLVLAAALALVAFWPAKNLVRFGFFGTSSWLGVNLARGLPVDRSPWGEMLRYGSHPAAERERAAAERAVPERFRDVPVLARATKRAGVPNWNHWVVVGYGRTMETRALEAIREEPGRLAARALRWYALFTRLPTERGDGALPERGGEGAIRWQRLYARLLHVPVLGPVRGPMVTPYGILLPAVLAGAAVLAWRSRRSDPLRAATLTLMLGQIAWVAAVVVLVDGEEGGRMRLAVEPLILLLAALLVARRRARPVPATRPDPEPG